MTGIKSRIISEDLLRRITSGDLRGALMLPSESKLAETYACSRPTIRKALAELRAAGRITGAKGSGSYITTPAEPLRKDNAETFLGIIFPNMGPEYFFDLLCNNLARIGKGIDDFLVDLFALGMIAEGREKNSFDFLRDVSVADLHNVRL